MADAVDPWENTKKLLGSDFFDRAPSEQQVRDAFEAELVACETERRPFSVSNFLDGVYEAADEAGAVEVVQYPPGHGNWISGPC